MTKMRPPAHPARFQILHWIGATSIICMVLSGWAIYNASRSLLFTFPDDSGLLWVIAEYSCAIDVASAFLIQVYGSAPISSRYF